MLFVKGDIHGDPRYLNSMNFPEGKTLTREDYVVILGDFGLVWGQEETKQEKHWLDWLEDKPWTTLFVDGNHENYDRLDALPEAEWNGGRVAFVRPHILHLKRGYVFNIDGCKCFCMGGAKSHDIRDGILDWEKDQDKIKAWRYDYNKLFRINHISWWEREMPSQNEFNRGLKALEENNWEVDFIFSHCASAATEQLMRACGLLPLGIDYHADDLNRYFNFVEERTIFRKHYFGHYHADMVIPGSGGKQELFYELVERIN